MLNNLFNNFKIRTRILKFTTMKLNRIHKHLFEFETDEQIIIKNN